MNQQQFTTIQSLGRSGLIRRIREKDLNQNKAVLIGIGDDAAVIRPHEESVSVVSTETFVEGVDFDLTFTPFHHLGAKVITAGVSDIYAMNAKPTALFINLSLPNRISVEMIDEFYRGVELATKDYDCQLAGGDIGAAGGPLVISITAYGTAADKSIIKRTGFKKDEAICVTGDLGGAMAGLNILLREKKHWDDKDIETMQPDLSPYEYVVKRQLVPIARRDLIDTLEEFSIRPTAMTDVTQGLVNELHNMFGESDSGAYIYEAALPIDLNTRSVADEMGEDADRYALYGGEDYELLFTLPEKDVEKLAEKFKDFVVIGKTTGESQSIRFQRAEGDVWEFEDK